MKSRSVHGTSGVSLMGLAVGLATGLAAGLLAAPMRGSDMRASLRARADGALDRGKAVLEDGRRAIRRETATAPPSSLTASMGEIAQVHTSSDLLSAEARS